MEQILVCTPKRLPVELLVAEPLAAGAPGRRNQNTGAGQCLLARALYRRVQSQVRQACGRERDGIPEVRTQRPGLGVLDPDGANRGPGQYRCSAESLYATA